MMFRDDLYQANRRIEDLEGELRAARVDRDHLAGTPITAPVRPIRPIEPKIARTSTSTLAVWEWWPFAAIPVLGIAYVVAMHLVQGSVNEYFDLPIDVIVASAIVSSAIYSLDVVLRSRHDKRTLVNRLILILACISAVPAGLFVVMLGMGLLSIVAPVVMISVVLYKGIRWLGTGKGFDD